MTEPIEEEHPTEIKKKKGYLFVPENALDRVFIDNDGKCWAFTRQLKTWLGMMEYDQYTFGSGDTLDKKVNDIVYATYQTVLSEWWQTDVQPAVEKLIGDSIPLFNACVLEGEKKFRKEFTQKLAKQGAGTFRSVVANFCEAIAQAWAKQVAAQKRRVGTDITYSTSGLVPPHVRLVWKMNVGKTVYEMFCLEFPPEIRTIRIFGKSPRVVFPWLCIFVCFKDGVFLSRHAESSFWVFYRKARLTSENDELYFPNLPHGRSQWPHLWCLGYNIPVIKLNDPLWSVKLLDYFWQTEFVKEGITSFWEEAASRIPEVASTDSWNEFAQRKWALQEVLKLPWQKSDYTVSSFTQRYFEYLTSDRETPRDREVEPVRELPGDEQARIIESIRGKLEESIHFLGSSLVVPPELEQSVKKVVDARMTDVVPRLVTKLRERCDAVGITLLDEIRTLT